MGHTTKDGQRIEHCGNCRFEDEPAEHVACQMCINQTGNGWRLRRMAQEYDAVTEEAEMGQCDSCGQQAVTTAHDDLSGNGEVHDLCSDCAEEMYESWDEEKQEPKGEEPWPHGAF